MFVIKEMRLNKFEPKPLVTNRELFASCGPRPATVESKETSDCFDSPTVQGASKTKMLGLAQDIVRKSYEHHKGEQTSELETSANDN